MRAITRLGATIFLSCLSLVTIIGLLPKSTVSTRLQKITLGTTIDSYVPSSIWNWASGDVSSVADGIRLVVFGDSWVDDTIFDGEQKKGKVWVQKLCEEINCTSLLNFAVSQPLEAYPSAEATGTMLSNEIYSSHNQSSLPRTSAYMPSASDLLPDFAAQIQKFLACPEPAVKPTETIFVVSFGMWDIYHYSGLDYSLSQSLTDSTIRELFVQLDILYNRYRQTVLADEFPVSGNNTEEPLPFRVIIPKLFDPTLLPGWVAQRPLPLAPSSASEQQKNAVYLTDRWNDILENKMGTFIKNDTLPSNTKAKIVNKEEEHADAKDEARTTPAPSAASENENEEGSTNEEASVTVRKDAFYYDLRKYLTDVIIEHQLEDAGLSDAAGLGTKGSPFESVYNPCVISADEEHREGDTEANGLLVCKDPAEYLFWDDFRLGPAANEKIGLDIADMVRKGKSVRKTWQDGKKGSS